MADDPIEVITTTELATYLGTDPGDPPAAYDQYVLFANGVVTEAWADPVDPIPWWVKSIALEAAGRAGRNPKGLSSWSRSIDDGSRTERLPEQAARAGVFLTTDEEVRLGRGVGRKRPRRFGSVRTRLGY